MHCEAGATATVGIGMRVAYRRLGEGGRRMARTGMTIVITALLGVLAVCVPGRASDTDTEGLKAYIACVAKCAEGCTTGDVACVHKCENDCKK